MTEIAQKNFEKNGEATLDREQFELLRRTIASITVMSTSKFKNGIEFKKEDFEYDNGVFIGFPNFGSICLN
jgi:hypothetical protein